MSVTNRLVFDPTGASGGSNVGAYVRAGDDGALIGSQTANSENWLNTTSILYLSDGTTPVDDTNPLPVTIDNTSITVTFAGFTSIENTATAVGTTAVNVVGTALTNRKELWFANEDSKDSIYWGKTGVTTSNGFPLHPGMQHQASIGAALTIQAIATAAGTDLRVMELA
jgi:hypothetical protein